jgi:protein-disulfide isomerase/uncharacterized membrane protein
VTVGQSGPTRTLRGVLTTCALFSCVTSLALSLQKVGVLADSLPGCSTAGGCSALNQSSFASVPLVGWPWAHVGTAWFAGLTLAVWGITPNGPGHALRWGTRLGALGSAYFLTLMIVLRSFCPWCFATHLGSLALWLLIARMRAPTGPQSAGAVDRAGSLPAARRAISPLTMGVALAIVTSVGLGVLEYRHADDLTRAAHADEAAMAKAIRDALAADPKATSMPPPDAPRDRLSGRFSFGNPAAPIRVVVFSDYECPDCRRIDREMDAIVQSGNVVVTPRHFPLCSDCNREVPRSLHPDACRRAMLAEAAGLLGGDAAFAKAHHALFALQDAASAPDAAGTPPPDAVEAVLAATGLDRAALLEKMTSESVRAAVTGDVDDALALGVTFTPMVFVNGREWKWYRSRQTLAELVAAISAEALPTIAPPSAADRLVDEWRSASPLRPMDPSEPQPFTLIAGPPDARDIPEVLLWLDYTVPGAAILDRELAALAAEGVAFRARVYQFPASSSCNDMIGLAAGKPESCLASLVAASAGIVGGDEGFRAAHTWLVTHANEISLESIAPTLDTLPGGRAAVIAAFGDGRGLDLTKRQAELLSKRTRVQSLPTLVVDGRVMPRWEHPGAPARVILRTLLAAAVEERSRQRGEIPKADGLGR